MLSNTSSSLTGHTTPLHDSVASADQQRISTEGRCEKLQQIINKTRSELDEARQQESQSKTTDLAMRGELELLRQQHEELKVSQSSNLV